MNGKIQNSLMNRALVLAFIGWVAVLPNRAEVMSVVFGSNPAEQPIPFEAGSGRMQQIYPSSLFDAVAAQQILISGISFRASQPFVTDVTGLRMLMAQTAAQGTAEDFSANLGGGAVEVLARGNYTINASSLSAVIPMPKGFVYDRTQGNLIVDIQFAGSSQPGWLEFSYAQGPNLMAFTEIPMRRSAIRFKLAD